MVRLTHCSLFSYIDDFSRTLTTPLDASLIHQIWTLPSSLTHPGGQLPTTQKTVTIRVLPGAGCVCWGVFRCHRCRIRGQGMQGGILVGREYVNTCKHHHN